MPAGKLVEFGVADEVLEEPLGGAHMDPQSAFLTLKESLFKQLQKLQSLSVSELLEKRYEKYRRMGMFTEELVSDSEMARTESVEKSSQRNQANELCKLQKKNYVEAQIISKAKTLRNRF